MKDELGDRIKTNYEYPTRHFLPRRNYTIIRVDGKAFHTYTKGLERPFDIGFTEDMNKTAEYLVKNIMGAKFAFTQSDEISILVTDFETIMTEAWYGNNLQKMCSISAAMATEAFNRARIVRHIRSYQARLTSDEIALDLSEDFKFGIFDSRVFQIPQRTEVCNYFKWRQQDTMRNSVSSVAHFYYSQSELQGKSSAEQQEMIFQKGSNWNNFDPSLKRGRVSLKVDRDYVTIAAPDFMKEEGWNFFAEHVLTNESLMKKWSES